MVWPTASMIPGALVVETSSGAVTLDAGEVHLLR